jgi:hypothetical protein
MREPAGKVSEQQRSSITLPAGLGDAIIHVVENEAVAMGAIRDEFVKKIFRGLDPFAGLPTNIAVEREGWNSTHPILREAATRRDPITIVEIGVWKGGSAITMAETIRQAGIDGVVICVDTWLGSFEHWVDNQQFPSLAIDHGYPSLNRTFMANIRDAGLVDYVLPFPLDSLNASIALWKFGVKPDVIHLDGGHDYPIVKADIHAWWERLNPGGLLIGDDYNLGETSGWEGVRQAFDEFFGAVGKPISHADGKCWIEK